MFSGIVFQQWLAAPGGYLSAPRSKEMPWDGLKDLFAYIHRSASASPKLLSWMAGESVG